MPADISELLALADEFDAAGAKVARASVEAVSEAADAGVLVGRALAPRGATGDLSASVVKVLDGGGGAGGARARVRATTSYAWFVYAGTARQAPQPTFMDSARDAAEAKLGLVLPQAVQDALP